MATCSQRAKEGLCGPLFGIDHVNPSVFFTSQWDSYCKCMPTFYTVYRILFSIFFLVVIVLTGFLQNYSHGAIWFIYLTNWSFLMLVLDTLIQAILVTYGSYLRRGGDVVDWELVFPTLPWYVRMEWVVTDIATAAGFLVTIMYWTIVYEPGDYLVTMTYFTHVANSIYLVLNLFLTAMPVRLSHIIFVIAYALLYLIFTVVYQLGFDQPTVYTALDWSNPSQAGLNYFLFGFVGALIVWIFIYLITEIRLAIYGATNKKNSYEEFSDNKSVYK